MNGEIDLREFRRRLVLLVAVEGDPFHRVLARILDEMARLHEHTAGSPRDITAYKKGLMLARQAAQPSCQLRWCGGGALGKQAITCQPDCSGARVRCGQLAHLSQIV